MLIEIKHRWSNATLCSFEAVDLKYAVIQAIKSGANLSEADLRRADLSGANLSEANLSEADLRRANLSGADLSEANLSEADLSEANLRRANLSGADLSGANLSEANLSGADLSEANLRRANLSEANLSGANLSEANLSEADLSGANLSEADLSEANLSEADLRRADLSGADLRRADLAYFKSDFFDILLRAPKEIFGLREYLIKGKVDGSCYQGECACLLGTIANIRHCDYDAIGNGISPNSSRPAEQWFMSINKGDTPETNQISKITVEWLDEFVGLLEAAK